MKFLFWKSNDYLEFKKNFPHLNSNYSSFKSFVKKQGSQLNEVVSGIIAAVAWVISFVVPNAIMGTTLGYALVQTVASVIVYGAITIGTSLLSSLLGSKPNAESSPTANNGRMINTRATTAPIRVIYGRARVGGNWIWATTSGRNAKYLHCVVTWGEGENEGIDKAIEKKADFVPKWGIGLDDMMVQGTYTGTENHYIVRIDSAAAIDTFTWSDDGASTWTGVGVSMTGEWQLLNNGVYVKFGATTGHGLQCEWRFWAGDGVFLGDRLINYFQNYGKLPVNIPALTKNLASHTFYSGTATQNYDTALNEACPTWTDTLKHTCYSIFKLKFNQNAWKGLPEFSIVLKGRKLYDTRTAVTAYSTNPALVWYDFMTNTRYGLGISSAFIDTASVNDAATWCDTNSFTFNGAIIDRKSFLDNLEDIMGSFRGYVIWSGGTYKLKIHTDDSTVMNLTEDDVDISPESFEIGIPGIPETPNRVKVIYIDPNYNDGPNFAIYPDADDVEPIYTDGDERVQEIVSIGVQTLEKAKQIAKFLYYRARFNKTFKLICSPRTIALEPGDMVNITHEFPGWTSKKVRVAEIGIPQAGNVPIVFMEEDSSIYDTSVHYTDFKGVHFPSTIIDYGPDITSVELSASVQRNLILLEWTLDEDDTSLYLWDIYRNTTNDSATATLLDQKSGQSRSYRDTDVVNKTTYYYWLKAEDFEGNESEDFTEMASVTYVARWSPLVHDTVPSGDVPSDDGGFAYIADSVELTDCDSTAGWLTDSAVPNSVLISKGDAILEGSGSIKVEAYRYAKVRYYEDGIDDEELFRTNNYECQGFITSSSGDYTAVGLPIRKYRSPNDLTISIYESSCGIPSTSKGSGTLQSTDVFTAFQPTPNDYIYTAFSSAITLESSKLYWLVMNKTAQLGNYYICKGNWGAVDDFGTSDEHRAYGDTLAALTHAYTNDFNFRLCKTGDALNKYTYIDLGAGVIDIHTKTYFKNYVRSSRTGEFLESHFGESTIATNGFSFSITNANQWELKSAALLAVTSDAKDAVRYVGIQFTSMGQDAIVHLDYFFANQGDPTLQIRRGADLTQILTNDILYGNLLRYPTIPFKISNPVIGFLTGTSVGTQTYTVTTGKHAFLMSARLNSTSSYFAINDSTKRLSYYQGSAGYPIQLMDYGLLLDDDDHVDLYTAAIALNNVCYCEVDKDPDIIVIHSSMNSTLTYTVPTSQTFVMTHMDSIYATTTDWDSNPFYADSNLVLDPGTSGSFGHHHFVFNEGTVLALTVSSGRLSGYLISKSA